MAGDPEKARRRARDEFTQINIRIRAQERELNRLSRGNPTAWNDARRQLKKLKEKRQDILRRMQ